ncbi:protein of unknown function (plasmid) [Methylocella tundrae]|uniref:Uncharacterized protein n=1 Tax=Methylocella tundrae TaxID=227605 RepID=A0A4U8Z833_METTU|nr:protein of unknown function [Methylocella tundrae]
MATSLEFDPARPIRNSPIDLTDRTYFHRWFVGLSSRP